MSSLAPEMTTFSTVGDENLFEMAIFFRIREKTTKFKFDVLRAMGASTSNFTAQTTVWSYASCGAPWEKGYKHGAWFIVISSQLEFG